MQESLREYVAAYNTLMSLKKTEDSMKANGSMESTIVSVEDNSEASVVAYEIQSQEFQRVQSEFEDYMERLKEDIDMKATKFGHVEYYDAKLRDGYSNEVAVAADQVHELDDRRKGLASVNPHFAKTSDLPPQPSVEDITFEHIALNLPVIAKNALEKIDSIAITDVPVAEEEVKVEEPVAETPVAETPVAETPVAENPVTDNPEEEKVEDLVEDMVDEEVEEVEEVEEDFEEEEDEEDFEEEEGEEEEDEEEDFEEEEDEDFFDDDEDEDFFDDED
jgi:hypothetical protein